MHVSELTGVAHALAVQNETQSHQGLDFRRVSAFNMEVHDKS